MIKTPAYYTYLASCADGSLYVGITTDLITRVKQHNGVLKGGAKYTRSRRPVSIAYYEQFPDRASATKREYELKQLTHEQKNRICNSFAADSVS